jgi:aspartate 1-decarboxylase
MRRHLLKSKTHRATITSVDLHTEGSLTLDEALLEAADLLPFGEVLVDAQNHVVRPQLRAGS